MEQTEIKTNETEINSENVSQIEIPENTSFDKNDYIAEQPELISDSNVKEERRGGKRKGAGRKKKTEIGINQSNSDSDVLSNGGITSENPDVALNNISAEINSKVDYIKDNSDENLPEEQKQTYSVLISGYVLLTILNAIMPSLLVKLLGFVIPKAKKVNPKNIALDKDEIEMLQPSADELVKAIFSTMSPVSQFLFAYTIITAGKLMLELQSINE